MEEIQTKRLILRRWQEEDILALAGINQDKEVMKYFPDLIGLQESREFVAKVEKHFDEYGYGLYACILKESGESIGFVGLKNVDFKTPFTPAVEIGWRIEARYWNKGYASEGAKSVLSHAFSDLGLREIVSFTAKGNLASRRVMEKIGMHYCEGKDFNHPKLKEGDPLCLHVLYRVSLL
jgi:RimJ/RimL family protein N-acetyltransferase